MRDWRCSRTEKSSRHCPTVPRNILMRTRPAPTTAAEAIVRKVTEETTRNENSRTCPRESARRPLPLLELGGNRAPAAAVHLNGNAAPSQASEESSAAPSQANQMDT